MAKLMMKWSNLLNMPELDFIGDMPPAFPVGDEVEFALSFLTAANRQERKLVRCDENGALLSSDPWNYFEPVGADTLTVANNVEDTVTFTDGNVGAMIATGPPLVQIFVKRLATSDDEEYYIPGRSYFWLPHSVYSIRARCVPYATGGNGVHGVTTFI